MAIGLALSGGGVKGAAHIGVLQALKEENIKVDYISGASSGSIVASLFAIGYSPYSILNLFNYYSNKIISIDGKSILKSFMNISKCTKSINKYDNLENILKFIFNSRNVVDICEVETNLAISTVDINVDKVVYFLNKQVKSDNINDVYEYKGNLSSIVKASCSYPVIFEPKIYKGRMLVDGGLKNNIPVSILKKMGADKIIAVDLSNEIYPLNDSGILNVGFRCLDILGKIANEQEIKEADIVIKPKKLSNINILDFKYINMAANEGYYATKKNINNIKNICK